MGGVVLFTVLRRDARIDVVSALARRNQGRIRLHQAFANPALPQLPKASARAPTAIGALQGRLGASAAGSPHFQLRCRRAGRPGG
jgi:hypothetical protein